MKAIALFFVLPCFIPGYHGLRLAPAWVGAVPEVPQGPEEVLSLETLERNHLFYHGTPVLVCNLLGDAEIVPNAEAEAEFLPDDEHDDAMGDAWNRRSGYD